MFCGSMLPASLLKIINHNRGPLQSGLIPRLSASALRVPIKFNYFCRPVPAPVPSPHLLYIGLNIQPSSHL